MNQLQTIIVVSHTHWDREWYRTFQQFRFHLVDTMDRLLDLLEDRPDFAHMLLDGQSIVLEDYLALRPQRAAEVQRLAEERRLSIGPWYVQPDEFLASGEALIRNLLLGHQVAAPLGPVMKVGWLPDTFGHIAQLPQILRAFDIDTFVSCRGLGDHLEQPELEFWWDAPDGSRVLTLYQHEGYWNAGNLGYPYFWGETEDHEPDVELALAKVRELTTSLAPLAASSTIAVWNGADHMPPQASLPGVIGALNDALGGFRVEHGRVEAYAEAIRQADPELPVVRGELRGSRYQNLHAPVLSSRIHLKQANHGVQRLLERYAEPLAAMAWLVGGSSHPTRRLWEAWRLLLQNHPHDSICGCSVDQVHCEMVSRFEQACQIGDCVVERSFDALAAQVDTSWCKQGAVPLLLFNPLGQPRREAVEVSLRLPDESACRITNPAGDRMAVEVLSASVEPYHWMDRQAVAKSFASEIPFLRQCLRELDGLDISDYWWEPEDDSGEAGETTLHLRLADRPFGSDDVARRLQKELQARPGAQAIAIKATYVLTQLALAADLPPCGYAAYAVALTDEPLSPQVPAPSGERVIENERLRVEVGPGGRLTLVDNCNGRVLRDLHQIEDSADRGDCYDHCPLPGGEGTQVLRGAVDVEVLHQNELIQALAIEHHLRVPASLDPDGKHRSAASVALPVRTVLKLRAGAPYVELSTTLDNQARDHRLRLLFPTALDTDTLYADGHFAVSARRVEPSAAGDWHQPPPKVHPHHTWFAASDGRGGLAVLSEGLPEHAGLTETGLEEAGLEKNDLKDTDGLTLALTLLRSVGWLSRGDLCTRKGHSGPAKATPNAQCLGTYTFRYGLLPFEGGPVEGGVPAQTARFDAAPVAKLTAPTAGILPPRQSIVSLEPDTLLLTALKRTEEGDRLLLRFYSVAPSPVQATIRFGFRAREAFRASASESPLEPLTLDDNGSACVLEVKPAEIVTLVVSFAAPLEPLVT